MFQPPAPQALHYFFLQFFHIAGIHCKKCGASGLYNQKTEE